MQPCMTCGSTTVNAIGNCTGCGTFRGAEAGQPAYGQPPPPAYPQPPQQYEQYQQPQYDQFGQYGPPQPYPAQPHSAQPYSAQPYSAQPQLPAQYPPQPYAQPYAQPPQQRRSNTGLIVGILVGVLVLLIGGGTAVAVVAYNNRDEPTSPTGTSPSSTASAEAAACVVGTWRESSSNYTMTVDGVSVNMTTSGAIQRFKADGSGELDMTAGTIATGTAGGKKYERATTGKINFKYVQQGDKIYYNNVTATGTSTIKVDGVAGSASPLQGSTDPDTFTCSGDTFVQSGATYRIELKRQ